MLWSEHNVQSLQSMRFRFSVAKPMNRIPGVIAEKNLWSGISQTLAFKRICYFGEIQCRTLLDFWHVSITVTHRFRWVTHHISKTFHGTLSQNTWKQHALRNQNTWWNSRLCTTLENHSGIFRGFEHFKVSRFHKWRVPWAAVQAWFFPTRANSICHQKPTKRDLPGSISTPRPRQGQSHSLPLRGLPQRRNFHQLL